MSLLLNEIPKIDKSVILCYCCKQYEILQYFEVNSSEENWIILSIIFLIIP